MLTSSTTLSTAQYYLHALKKRTNKMVWRSTNMASRPKSVKQYNSGKPLFLWWEKLICCSFFQGWNKCKNQIACSVNTNLLLIQQYSLYMVQGAGRRWSCKSPVLDCFGKPYEQHNIVLLSSTAGFFIDTSWDFKMSL